ncbi:MAG: Nramp family divalent metal transporter [Chitinophagaceae bacterium]
MLPTLKKEKKVNQGWKRGIKNHSLSEVFSSVQVPINGKFWKTLLAFTGPGLLISVGYMDPGNWATDLAGGAQFGYLLLSVILLSNFFAILLQNLALKLGVATERDLAQACRDHFNPVTNFILWIFCEIAIGACDLAEVIGSAIALQLLFHVPLAMGVIITAFDVLFILFFQKKGFRLIESIVTSLILVIVICFGYEIISSRPDLFPLLKGFIPQPSIITHPSILYIAIGIIGATVMPHNLYLHSSIVQTRNYPRTYEGKKMAIRFGTIDSTVALFLAFFVNAAILIVAAASFHHTPYQNVAEITDAQKLLTPLLGASMASTLFAVALLASGQNSTLTGTLAGQIVMEGFLHIRLKPWLRRLITRLMAIIPALIVTILYGEKGMNKLLILSQVILSMQLGFAMVPLLMFTNDREKMGPFVNKKPLKILIFLVTAIIIALNAYLLLVTFKPNLV